MDREREREREREKMINRYNMNDLFKTFYLDFDDVSDFSLDSSQLTAGDVAAAVAAPRGRKKNLNKMASAAGRKIRKLRRNWSLKKNDLTRSFSKIRRASLGGGIIGGESSAGGGGRRRSSKFYLQEESLVFSGRFSY